MGDQRTVFGGYGRMAVKWAEEKCEDCGHWVDEEEITELCNGVRVCASCKAEDDWAGTVKAPTDSAYYLQPKGVEAVIRALLELL